MKPDRFPIDASTSFKPNAVFHLKLPHGLSSRTEIKDVSEHATEYATRSSETVLNEANEAAGHISEASYTGVRKSRFPVTEQSITSQDGKEMCTITTNLLRLGGRVIAFSGDYAVHCSHDIELKTTSIGSGTEYFVKESEIYFWQAESAKHRLLYKVVERKRVLVAEYKARHGYSGEGVLAVNGNQVDVVIAIVTAFALLTRNDSWTS